MGEIGFGVVRRRSRRRRKRSHGGGKDFGSTNDLTTGEAEAQGVKPQRQRNSDNGTHTVYKSINTSLSQEHPQISTRCSNISSVSQNTSSSLGASSTGDGLEMTEEQYRTQKSQPPKDSETLLSSDYTRPLMGEISPHAASRRKHLREIDPHHLQREAAKGQYRKSRSNSVPVESYKYIPRIYC
jgi:hypothetical protein